MPRTSVVSVKEVGQIKEIRKSIVRVAGLSNCMIGQLVNLGEGTKGFIMGFNENEVLTLLLGDPAKLKAGMRVYSEAEPFRIPVGDEFLGRIVNPLCEPIDGKPGIKNGTFYDMFSEAPAVLDRIPIEEMFITGIRVIDSAFPVGKGQRQLIIGDRMTGKTAIAVDAILNQKDRNVICIYCCVGRDYASFEKAVSTFKQKGALDYMVVVSALASSPIGEQYLAPYTAATLGEYFMRSGRDVFIAFDDLTKHAWAYRELSLLLERPPGREAYPGDVFYLHAQLMEKAGKLSEEKGGGSMTFFPLADTLHGDIAGFIPTNLISMTDGQIYLNSTLFGEGFKPAVDLGLSVSRIGSRVQSPLMRVLTKGLGLEYIQYRELLKTTKLRAATYEDTAARLVHGEKIERIFIQEQNRPSPVAEQLILFYALRKKILDRLPNKKCDNFKKNIFAFAEKQIPDIVKKMETGKDFTERDAAKLNDCIVAFFKR